MNRGAVTRWVDYLLAQPSYDSSTFAGIAVWDAEALELLDNDLRRALFLEGEFGVAVQSPPDLNHARINTLCFEASLGHGIVSAEHRGIIYSREAPCRIITMILR